MNPFSFLFAWKIPEFYCKNVYLTRKKVDLLQSLRSKKVNELLCNLDRIFLNWSYFWGVVINYSAVSCTTILIFTSTHLLHFTTLCQLRKWTDVTTLYSMIHTVHSLVSFLSLSCLYFKHHFWVDYISYTWNLPPTRRAYFRRL